MSLRRSTRSRKPVVKYSGVPPAPITQKVVQEDAESSLLSGFPDAENDARVLNASTKVMNSKPLSLTEKVSSRPKKRPADDIASAQSPQKRPRVSTLFDAIADKKSAVLPQVRNIVTMISQNPSSSVSVLAEFILRSCGSEELFTLQDLSDDAALEDELRTHAAAVLEASAECYLGDSTKAGTVFTRRYARFWKDLIKEGGIDVV